MERGLVDELGGLDEAIRAAKAAANIPEEERVGLKTYPLKRSLLKRLTGSDRGDTHFPGLELLQELQGVLESELFLQSEVLLVRSPIIGT